MTRDDADGLSAAMSDLTFSIIPSLFLGGQGRWYLGWLGQDDAGRWGAMLQGPTRAKQVHSDTNKPTAAAAIRDLCAKARASRWARQAKAEGWPL